MCSTVQKRSAGLRIAAPRSFMPSVVNGLRPK
jgi:hypothetical protein